MGQTSAKDPNLLWYHVFVTSKLLVALGIATVYAFAGFSFSLAGIALACGVRSPADAAGKLATLKEWGPVSSM